MRALFKLVAFSLLVDYLVCSEGGCAYHFFERERKSNIRHSFHYHTVQDTKSVCSSLYFWHVFVTIVLAYLTGGGSLVVYGSGVVHKSCELAFGR